MTQVSSRPSSTTTAPQAPALQATSLTALRGARRVLDGVSLSLHAGE